MKKLAFLLSLFVGLNASGFVRRSEEEENQAVIIKDSPRTSTAALISLIANKLKACYYGITKEGFLQELKFDLIKKMKNNQNIENQTINPNSSKNILIRSVAWIQISYYYENGNETVDYQFIIKNPEH